MPFTSFKTLQIAHLCLRKNMQTFDIKTTEPYVKSRFGSHINKLAQMKYLVFKVNELNVAIQLSADRRDYLIICSFMQTLFAKKCNFHHLL